MALATRCPSCHALFRVVADQLKLRGGLVRCGACGQVFDAIGTLSYLDDASLRPVVPSPAAPRIDNGSALTLRIAPSESRPEQAEVASGQMAEAGGSMAASRAVDGETPAAATDTAPKSAEARFVDPRLPASAGDPNEAFEFETDMAVAPAANGAVEPLPSSAIDRAQSHDVANRAADSLAEAVVADENSEYAEEPTTDAAAFLQEMPARRKRSVAIAYATGALLLFVALAMQLAFFFRAELIAHWPAARPAFVTVCQWMNCSVGWPTRGEMLAVVGSELQSLPGTSALELTAVVRNRASVTLALPAIEVTLTDTQNRAIARRILEPTDYLAAGDAAARLSEGIEAGADMTVRIIIEARGLNAAGFVVYPFYL